ncbi:MAG: peptidase [Hyphococcus sp.]|nr:MAG: peptidase [Marinicaulis sp.]
MAKCYRPLAVVVGIMLAFGANAVAQKINVYERPVQAERTHDFDVLHYQIKLQLEETTKSFEGETIVTLRALRDEFDEVILDAETFVVESVKTKSGAPLPFQHSGGKLNITLNTPRDVGDIIDIKIAYRAVNVDVDGAAFGLSASYDLGLDFKAATEDNPQLINTLSWPEGARHWFPSYDHPSDRATQETIVTAPLHYNVISNGRLVSVTENADGATKTTHWKQEKNHPTYVFVMAAGPYVEVKDSYGDLPTSYWVYPDAVEIAPIAFAETSSSLQFFEEFYGVEYPWVKYDQITIPGITGGAESTSATVVGDNIIREPHSYDDFPSAWLVAHEGAHQWWGDLITYRDWTHNWLAESFATYSEYRYSKHALGDDEGAVNLLGKKNAYLKEAREKYQRPIVFDRWEFAGDNFDRHGYEKGATVVNMLEGIVGEEKFHKILKAFLTRYAFKSAVTEDFITIAEEVAEQDLRWFFDQWLFSPGHPVFDVSYDWDEASERIALTIAQTQDTHLKTPIFKVPVKIGITTDAGVEIHELWIGEKRQTFVLSTEKKPLLVRFDVGDVLLKEWTFEKETEELVFQLEHDNSIGRAWAAAELAGKSSSPMIGAVLAKTAKDDQFWAVRKAAIEALRASEGVYPPALYMDIAQTDKHSRVRAAAVTALSGSNDKASVTLFKNLYKQDQSYLVQAAALKALGATGNPKWKALIRVAGQRKSPRNVLKKAADEALENFQ